MANIVTFETFKTEVLIIGAGGAGLRAAVEAARAGVSVTIVSRAPIGRGGLTATANGGYHAAVWPGDSPEIHAEDMIEAGDYLNDRNLAKVLAEEAPARAKELESFGIAVDWNVPPTPAEPEMRFPRSLFIPGKEMLLVMGKFLAKQTNVKILEDYLLMRLLKNDGCVTGGVFFNIRTGGIALVSAGATILASGSYGEIYPKAAQEPLGVRTGSTGIGQLAAAEAGADLADMEMVQIVPVPFDPVTILSMRCLPWSPMVNARGETFLPKGRGPYSFHVAQSIRKEYDEGRGPVYMDCTDQKPPSGPGRHAVAAYRGKYLGEIGATPYKRRVQVGLGALFAMGGIHINERCETGVPGLFAAGEVSAGVHGGRRVSGSALPEIIVFGARAGQFAAEYSKKGKAIPGAAAERAEEERALINSLTEKKGGCEPQKIRNSVKELMGNFAYIERDGKGLGKALAELDKLEAECGELSPGAARAYNLNLVAALDARSLVRIGKVVCTAGLLREESRGFHYRRDFPRAKETAEHTAVRIQGGALSAGTKPVQTN
ncbi:MAG: FAD-binding protein [Treponema sp.]|jgi:succinate dehydrogenase/fumarate reductase flavoprotein subunit|nr:FAD-binding protein [Treponema sp.]